MRRTMTSTSLFVFALAMLGALTVQAQDADDPAEPSVITRADEPAAATPVEPNIIADAVGSDDSYVEGSYVEGSVGHIHSGQCTTCYPRPGRNPDLFYNYYQPPGCGTAGADLYMSPGEVPARVGHTYITYQPLMPHEFLYPHHRTYYQYYDGGRGLNRTSVKYYHSPFRKVGNALHSFRIAR